jgi:hypothetical protein
MRDEELKDLGLPNGAITQLRSIMTKISSTNGLCSVDKREPVPNTGRRKMDGAVAELEQVITGHHLLRWDEVGCVVKVLRSPVRGWVSELVCLIFVKLYTMQHGVCGSHSRPHVTLRIFPLKCVCIVKFHNPNLPPAVVANVCKYDMRSCRNRGPQL